MALEDHKSVSEANPGCCSISFPPSISIIFVRELEVGKEGELQPQWWDTNSLALFSGRNPGIC